MTAQSLDTGTQDLLATLDAGVLTCGGGNLRVPARDERTGRAKQGGP